MDDRRDDSRLLQQFDPHAVTVLNFFHSVPIWYMPASVSTPSTSVANKRMPRRIPRREAGNFDGVLVRRVVLGMRRLSGAMVTKPPHETQETHPGAKKSFDSSEEDRTQEHVSIRMPVDEPRQKVSSMI